MPHYSEAKRAVENPEVLMGNLSFEEHDERINFVVDLLCQRLSKGKLTASRRMELERPRATGGSRQ
jgi:hypothetical protein